MVSSDYRRSILDDIEAYQVCYPDESAVVRRFRDFIEGNVNCFERELDSGHLTGSSLLLDKECERVLLTHHAKLDKWLQPGGHADGEKDIADVCLREAMEESGLGDIEFLHRPILDLDIHFIPSRQKEPGHFHYDCRFLLRTRSSNDYVLSPESKELAWVEFDQVHHYTEELSILRMISKAVKILYKG